MICFAANAPTSLQNANKWAGEIRQSRPNTPLILVLTKSDLKDYCENPIDPDDIKKKCKELGFQGDVQTSSKEWEDFNVHKAF